MAPRQEPERTAAGTDTSVDLWDPTDPEFGHALTLFGLDAPPALVFVAGLRLKGALLTSPQGTNLYAIAIRDPAVLGDRERLAAATNAAHEVVRRSDPRELAGYLRKQSATSLLEGLGKLSGGVGEQILRLKPKFMLPGGISLHLDRQTPQSMPLPLGEGVGLFGKLARMDLGLRGKTAIVAAASQGLGKGVAQALAAEGANVVMFARNAATIEASARDVAAAAGQAARVLGVVADVTNTAHLERVVKTTIDAFGSVGVLFNNAGGPKPGMFDSLTDDDWQGAFELNLMSAIRLTRLCLPSMRARHWGRIITSTSSSVKQPLPTLMLSNAVRSATTAWSKTLSDQVAADGITVNTLAPGRIRTERILQIDSDAAQRLGRAREEVERDSRATIPVRRYGEPAEFGAAAAFLASEQAAYITGVTLLVDGGLFRGTY